MIKNLLITLIALTAIARPAAARPQLTPQLDSAYLLMGKKTVVKVQMLRDGEPRGVLVVQDKKMPAEVEISDAGVTDTVSLGNNRWELRRNIVIQSFDSGFYTLPPVLYVEGNETIASGTLALKEIPVAVDSLTDIHDYAGTADAGLRWTDRLPDWLVDYGGWILAALLAIAAGLFVWFKWFYKSKGKEGVRVVERKIPPYEAAVGALNRLREEKLCEQGQEKEYYTRLTEILRVYLQDRFGINAMEMTSSEILEALKANEETRLTRRYMSEILSMADFVKFAKVRPLPDDNVKTFRSAMQFVEDTRPVEPTDVKPTQAPEKK